MIKSLKIQNFQSHEETKLEFSSGVNVIIGTSDSGKTALIRAMRWLIWNRPSGDSICSTWGGNTSAQISTEEGFIIRSKYIVDKYTLGYTGQKDNIFKAFGTSVPEEISDFLNINEINFQQQLDAPFLLSNSSGEVAQHFNRIAHLEKIDIGIQNVQREVRELEQEIKFKTNHLAQQEEQLRTFDYLDKMEIEVEVLEEIDERCLNLIRRESKLESLILDLKDINVEIRKQRPLLKLEELVNQTLLQIKQKDELEDDAYDLLLDINDIKDTEKAIEERNELLKWESSVSALFELSKNKEILVERKISLFKALKSINNIKPLIEVQIRLQDTLSTKFRQEMGDVCILCGQTIKGNYGK